MNINDSEIIAGLLDNAGYSEAASPETSDIILINTCCVRQKAEDKAMGYALSLISHKMRNPKRILGLIGCIAEKDKDSLFKKLPFFDLIVGPGQEARIVQLIEEIKCGGNKKAATGDFCGGDTFPSAKRSHSISAYVTIMTGCDNYCSYCVVPYVRGREMSRSEQDIIREIKGLDKLVVKEITLLGQNVNSYKGLGARGQVLGLEQLLEKVHDIDGIERIRFLTSHPRDMSDGIINAVRDLPKVCEYFHLPMQSGDDRILKAMNRGYTSDHYRKLVEKIRDRIPGASITSDVIVGFPGETDEEFRHSCELIRELELDYVNTAAYSARPITSASKMEGQLPEKIKEERLHIIMRVVEETAARRNKGLEGSVQEILVERITNGKLSGRTRGNKLVKFKGEKFAIGKTVKARITKGGPFVLEGMIN